MGDCAEKFLDCTEDIIKKKQQFMDICADLVQNLTSKRVTKVGRIAGQYAKPRTQEFDQKKQIYNFKGDNINDLDEQNRTPDPTKLYEGYIHAISTLNTLRAHHQDKCIAYQQYEQEDLHLLNTPILTHIFNNNNNNNNEKQLE